MASMLLPFTSICAILTLTFIGHSSPSLTKSRRPLVHASGSRATTNGRWSIAGRRPPSPPLEQGLHSLPAAWTIAGGISLPWQLGSLLAAVSRCVWFTRARACTDIWQVPGNLVHSDKNRAVLDGLLREKAIECMAHFGSGERSIHQVARTLLTVFKMA